MKCSCQYFQENYPDCTSCSKDKKILVQENKRKYILENLSSKQICKIRIDGCVIDAQTQRKCDYLIIVCKPENESNDQIDTVNQIYFIELKGKDLIGAVEQLTQTIEYFKTQVSGKLFARVVLSKVSVPRTIEVDARVKKLKDIVKKQGGNFEYTSGQYDRDKV